MKDGSNRSILSDFDRNENLLPGFGEKEPEVTDESYLKEIEGIMSGRIPPPIGGPTPPPMPHRPEFDPGNVLGRRNK